MESRLFKVVVIGASGAGKSCLLLKYTDDVFIDTHISTIGVDFRLKDVRSPHPVTGEEQKVKLQIWDTAGQERFRTITNSFYRGAHSVLVVYDVGDITSFTSVPAFVADAKRFAPSSTKIYLAGNKADHAVQVITQDAADQMANSLGISSPSFLTSAKTGAGIEGLFDRIAADMLENHVRRLYEIQQESARFKLGASEPVCQDKKPKNCDCIIL